MKLLPVLEEAVTSAATERTTVLTLISLIRLIHVVEFRRNNRRFK